MPKTLNRYQAIIDKIFFDHYRKGETSFEFHRKEIKSAAQALGIDLPDNLGDVIYSFRFRSDFARAGGRDAARWSGMGD